MEPERSVIGGIELTNDVLEQQGRNLRALARCLLRDAHAADDVVQETWLACFAQPAGIPGRLSAWLGTVARRLAARRMRGEGRRRSREEFAATQESVEALHELALEREEALRVVTQALLELDEPFKSTLILRYYDGRSPTQIAQLQGLPLATVKSRLARGLERLRDKLDGAFGGDADRRTRALGLLAGVPLPELVGSGAALTAGTASTTVGTLTGTTKALLALAAACLVGVVLWTWHDEPHAPLARVDESHAQFGTPQTRVAELAAEASPDSARGADADAAPERRPVTTIDEPLTDPLALIENETLFPYRVSGVVRDERDQPQPGARVYFAPRGFVVNRVATTDDDGRFAFEFDGRRATFDGVFAAAAGDTYLDLCEVRLVSGQEFTIDIALDARANLRSNDDAWSIEFAGAGGSEESLAALHVELPNVGALRGTRPFADAPECLRLPNGRVCFIDPPPQPPCTRPSDDSMAEQLVWAHTQNTLVFDSYVELLSREWGANDLVLTLDAELLRFEIEVAVEGASVSKPSVSGVARRLDGTPAAGVRVAWSAPDGSCGDVTTSAGGAFMLAALPPGEVALHVGGGDEGVARARFELTVGEGVVWDPLLDRGDEVSGRVIDAHSRAPLANARVELWSTAANSLWCDSAWTDADGCFALPNVPAGALELHVRSMNNSASDARGTSVFPPCVVRPVFGRSDVGVIEVDARPEALSALALSVVDANGAPVPDAHVSVWHAATGRGVFAGDTSEPGGFALGGLPSGPYRIEVAGPSGRLDFGVVTVDPRAQAELDLGELRLPPTGAALIVVEPSRAEADVSEVNVCLWSAHPDVFGHVATRGSRWRRAVLPLHAGAYVVWTSDASGANHRVPLDVPSGAAAGLTLEQAPNGAITPRLGAVDRELGASASAAACAACHAPR